MHSAVGLRFGYAHSVAVGCVDAGGPVLIRRRFDKGPGSTWFRSHFGSRSLGVIESKLLGMRIEIARRRSGDAENRTGMDVSGDAVVGR